MAGGKRLGVMRPCSETAPPGVWGMADYVVMRCWLDTVVVRHGLWQVRYVRVRLGQAEGPSKNC